MSHKHSNSSQHRAKPSPKTQKISTSSTAPSASKKHGADFAFRVRYKNTLPPPPFDPKLLEYPFPSDKWYNLNQQHRTIKFGKGKRSLKLPSDVSITEMQPQELIPPDSDLGMSIDLFHLGVFERELTGGVGAGMRWSRGKPGLSLDAKSGSFLATQDLDEKDRIFLEHPDGAEASGEPAGAIQGSSGLLNRGRPKRPLVTWLRPTQYISSEVSKQGQTTTTPVESKMGQSVLSDPNFQRNVDTSPEAQIRAIEATFDKIKKHDFVNLRHPTNPELRVKEVFPFVPDFENWGNDYVLVHFPEDPSTTVKNVSFPEATSEGVLVKECTDREETVFGAMYLPIHETAMRLRRRRDNEEWEQDDEATDRYIHTRDYNLEIEERQDRIFVRIVDDEETGQKAALWQRLPKFVRAGRRRALVKDQYEEDNHDQPPDEIQVKTRRFTKKERRGRVSKLAKMMPSDVAEKYLSIGSAWGEEEAESDEDMDIIEKVVVEEEVQEVAQTPEESGMDLDAAPDTNNDLVAELAM